ncbi:methyltransferase [Microbacterium excoecariae]|uniref:methyltransferase n=1 Tax=Microbacterium excoecariae TaxID=2715210 RepID=UPI00140A5971|nr:methyltransferase [Microbacterium excoecariae]NHI16934.1 methyltransferase [Microbacterium excoecariae]
MGDEHGHRIFVAYGKAGAVGSIRAEGADFLVTMAGSDEPLGTYPTLEIAKNALSAQLGPAADRPEFHPH